ncbi:MAG: hypothetical protein JXQ69_03720 [Paludibacteraceae bacterium]|nr:hypothetical protein [Paludibacteraceae bacterium]
MELTLRRIAYRDSYTIGHLYVNGQYFCDTIEDVVRDNNRDGDLDDPGEEKVFSKTAIPQGRYVVVVNKSPRFKRLLPLLLNVKDFEGIRIHNGIDENSSSGCIIVGENKEVGKVTNGRVYMNKLTDLIITAQRKNEKVIIQIS